MGAPKIYTRKELEKKLTPKEKNFCHEYVVDWNGARAARAAGYSENSDRQIATVTLSKVYIQQYVEFIKDDFEMLCGISKTKQLQELYKIAYSSIAHLHNTWIELRVFDELSEDQKASIESIDTKTEQKLVYNPNSDKKENIDVKYVKIKLYPKVSSIQEINKMMGYYEPDKVTQIITVKEQPLFSDEQDENNK